MRAFPHAVLFDLDDTLVDHQFAFRSSLTQLQARHSVLAQVAFDKLEAAYVHYLDFFHQKVLDGEIALSESRAERFKHLFQTYGETLTHDQATAIAQQHREDYIAAERPIPGITPLLECLREKGCRIGVITNHTTAEQTAKLQRCGLTTLVDGLITSEEAGIPKPDPAIFHMMLKRLNCEAHETIMVGDSWQSDIVGAHTVKIPALWLNRYTKTCPDPAIAREFRSYIPLDTILNLIAEVWNENSI